MGKREGVGGKRVIGLTIGSAVWDQFFSSSAFRVIESPDFSTGYGECVALGSKIPIEDFYAESGGGATNVAASLVRFGIKAQVVAVVGDDSFGEMISSDLKARGVGVETMVTMAQERTGVSVILNAQSGERSILTYRGASEKLSRRFLPVDFSKFNLIYTSSLHGQLPTWEEIGIRARRAGAFWAVNPGQGELIVGGRWLERCGVIDLLLVNKEEGQLLLPGGVLRRARQLVAGTKSSHHQLIGDLAGEVLARIGRGLSRFAETVIVTDGENGAVAIRQDEGWRVRGDKSIVKRSSTGAGDAFGAASAFCLATGGSIETALAAGVLNAQNVIKTLGAKTGILKRWPKTRELNSIVVTKFTL